MSTQLALPLARATDPSTSSEAAQSMRPANGELIERIRHCVNLYGPLTHAQIADTVMQYEGSRWTQGTIVTACARAGLFEWDRVTNARGRTVIRWSTEKPYLVDVPTMGDVL